MSRNFIAKHVEVLPKSGIRDFFSIASTMKDCVSLGVGEPDFVTPWNIREATIRALEKGKTSYTDNLGLAQLRMEISKHVEKNYNISYDYTKEIMVTVGASEALDVALRAIINPGDKIMYHEPCFVSYMPSILLAHGVPVPVKTYAKDNFSLNIQELRDSWQEGCKALMINFPANPTGATLDMKTLQELADFAIEKDMLIISDEIYSDLCYEGKTISIASLPKMKERTIYVHGFSKAFAMTGFRMGYVCAPADILDAMMKIHQYGIMCASIIAQEAAIEALKHSKDAMLKMVEQYQKRRDYIIKRFNDMGLVCKKPKGTFYAFASIGDRDMSSLEFCKKVLEKSKVAIVPGCAFGESGEGFFRASFATSYDNIIEACDRLEKVLKDI
ncbi:MAG: aminotransferase class I/II-fold pyridoxal phosphate-dependent enzyme [Opitutales bacterium]